VTGRDRGDPGAPVILRASHVLPVHRRPIPDGAVAVRAGRLEAVGPWAEVRRDWPEATVLDLGRAALLPGLVNAHTHLELSGLGPPAGLPRDFAAWMIDLVRRRRAAEPAGLAAAAGRAARALVRSGTTAVGDISATGLALDPLRGAGLRGVVFHEVLGFDPARAEALLGEAERGLASLGEALRDSRLRPGLTPHALYTSSEALVRGCLARARDRGLRACVHVAEHPAEVEFTRAGTGRLREVLHAFAGWSGLEAPAHERRPIELLGELSGLAADVLLVHAVQATSPEIARIAAAGAPIAHCPRSNVLLGAGIAPIPALLERRVAVGLGTDSLASNWSLSLWDELRFAHRLHGGRVAPGAWLAAATLGGARALGLEREVGTLEAGKAADLTGVVLPSEAAADPVAWLAGADGAVRVLLTMVDGQALHADPSLPLRASDLGRRAGRPPEA
jgi:cytosine/adenosine deaminase-related metal-dependent hydrolase